MNQESSGGVSRREFLNKSLKSGVALAISPLFLATTNCVAPSKAYIKKDLELIGNTKWDANPIIPIPENGCYTGFFQAMPDVARVVNWTIDDYVAYAKKIPTVMSPGTFYLSCSDDIFLKESCETLIERGIIPYLRYAIIEEFKNIYQGKADREIITFAKQIKEFKNPIFLVPYPEINLRAGHSTYPWSGTIPTHFKKAWRHMHDIFQEIGANDNTVWCPHFIDNTVSYNPQNFDMFYPGDEYVDWIGFSVFAANFNRKTGESFDNLFSRTYKEVRRKYPNKPIAILELDAENNSFQTNWIRRTFISIKAKYPAVKLYIWYNSGMAGGFSGPGMEAYGQAISDPYFISSILPHKK